MNFLAHSFLSFSDEQIVGQFLNDHIKNKDRLTLPKGIFQGVVLHRSIDSFTDSHPEISEAKKIFAPLVTLYSGAFVDVAMDYFLANDPKIFSPEDWKNHAERVYAVLENYLDFFPENFKNILDRMKSDNWLYNYREDWGIEFSLKNVLNRARYLDRGLPVFNVFLENKPQLKEHYDAFFPDLQKHIFELNESF